MDAVKSKIYEVSRNMPEEIDYQDKIVKLKDAISGMTDPNITPLAKNKLLKTIVERIDYEYLNYEGHGKVRYRLHIRLRL
jgi:hypothetical protein